MTSNARRAAIGVVPRATLTPVISSSLVTPPARRAHVRPAESRRKPHTESEAAPGNGHTHETERTGSDSPAPNRQSLGPGQPEAPAHVLEILLEELVEEAPILLRDCGRAGRVHGLAYAAIDVAGIAGDAEERHYMQ